MSRFVTGQVKSHCVPLNVPDIIEKIREEDPVLAAKVCTLEDYLANKDVSDANWLESLVH
jgi:hypothetical protein